MIVPINIQYLYIIIWDIYGQIISLIVEAFLPEH